jgi:hypothetical protein
VQSAGKWDFLGTILLKKNPWTKSTDWWTMPARSTMDRRPSPRVGAHRSSAFSHSDARELRPRGRQEEGSMGVPILGSPGLRRRWSSGATTVKAAVDDCSTRARSGHGERGRRGGGGAVGGADVEAPFYRVKDGAGRPSFGEERATAVVRHNGDEGVHFRRGSAGE